MSEYINPKMIEWARKRNLLSVEELAALMKKEPAEIRRWEAGTEVPSYANLEVLSHRHFKIPLALFFFPEPPAIEDPVSKFRRLPDYELRRISMDTMQMMRTAQGYQESLAEFAAGGKGRKKLFRDLDHKGKTVHALANETREYLGITLKKQMAIHSSEETF